MSGFRARTGLKVTGSILATLGLAAVMTVSVAAAAPNVNTGSGITVDGDFADWTEADFFADMYRAAKPDMPLESKLYLRYDCAAGILFVRVDAEDGVTIPTNDHDNNFVKFGNDKKVDGTDAPPNGTQPEFAYAGTDGWEASFAVSAPFSITDLDVHAQVQHDGSQTSAVAGRAIPMNITCETTAAAATVTPPSCTAAGTLVVPADTDSVMYSVEPAYTAGATGEFTVTATAKTGYVLSGTSEWTLTVAPQVTGVACATAATAAAGSITPPSCTAAGTLVIPANTASVTYSVSPAYTAGASGTFTVTATANAGFVLSGTSAWTLTVAPQVTGAACITEGTLGSSGGPAGGLPNTAVPVELAASFGALLVIASGIGFSLTRRRMR